MQTNNKYEMSNVSIWDREKDEICAEKSVIIFCSCLRVSWTEFETNIRPIFTMNKTIFFALLPLLLLHDFVLVRCNYENWYVLRSRKKKESRQLDGELMRGSSLLYLYSIRKKKIWIWKSFFFPTRFWFEQSHTYVIIIIWMLTMFDEIVCCWIIDIIHHTIQTAECRHTENHIHFQTL